MRRAAPIFAAALLSLVTAATAATITTVLGTDDPSGASGPGSPPDTMRTPDTTLSSVPALTTDLPEAAPRQDRPAAAVGASQNGSGAAAPEGVSIGTVRMLLSPPPAPPRDGD